MTWQVLALLRREQLATPHQMVVLVLRLLVQVVCQTVSHVWGHSLKT